MPEPYGVNSIPKREGFEGIYLLTNTPCSEMPGYIPPVPFSPDGLITLRDSVTAIALYFQNNEVVHSWWDKWVRIHVPVTPDVNAFVRHLVANGVSYRVPLAHIILDRSTSIDKPGFSLGVVTCGTRVDPDFVWPALLAAAMNSVQSSFNLHPHEPRMYISSNDTDGGRLTAYKDKTLPYFAHLAERGVTNAMLEETIKRLVDYRGENLSHTGSKGQLIAKIKFWAQSSALVICRNIIPVNATFVDSYFSSDASVDADHAVIINDFEISRRVFKQLRPGQRMEKTLMDVILHMFRKRDMKICRLTNTFLISLVAIRVTNYFLLSQST